MSLDTSTLVTLGRLINRAYSPTFLVEPQAVELSDLGHALVQVIYAHDLDFRRPYGFIANNIEGKHFTVVLRGTETTAEWISDFLFRLIPCSFIEGTLVEHGFAGLYSSLKTESGLSIKDFLSGVGTPVTVTGHSLGGALATLLAADMNAACLVTFGGPRVGDSYFCGRVERRVSNLVRVVNVHDVVPKSPLEVMGFDHAGPPLALDSAGAVQEGIHCKHSLDTYLHLLDAAQPLNPACLP